MTTKIPVELSSTPGIVDSSNATAITIDSSENISINSGDVTLATASKRYYVPRASDAAATGSLYSPADSDIRLSGAGSSAGELQFEPSSTSGVTVTITSAGKVGIRDTTPDAVLKVNSTGGGSELAFKVADASDNSVFEVQGGGTAVFQYGHVGIANTSPGSYDSNARNLVVGSGSGDEGMTIASGSGSGGRIYFADGTSSDGEKGDGYIFYNHASNYMAFGTSGGTENARFLDGSLLIGSTTLDGNSQKFQVFQNANNKFTGMFICDGNNVNRFGPCIRAGTDDNSGTNTMLTFQDGDGSGIGTITSSGGTMTYGAFTAHHEVNVPDEDNPSDDSDAYPYGTLVEVTSVYLTEANKRQSIRYTIQKSQSANSKKVLGAYSSNMRPSPMCPTTGTYANNLHNISILGDGHILCNNSGGNIEVGDGICTSAVEGIGMKATTNPSMIVGIAQEDVTFSGSETKLVAVQFGVQQFTPWS